MARVPLPPEPGDTPKTQRYRMDYNPDISAGEIKHRVEMRKASGELIRPEDIGNVPIHGEYLTWNKILLESQRQIRLHELEKWYQTWDGKLYKFLQDVAQEKLRKQHGNPQGSYSGSIKADIGSTQWMWSTGSGWSEPTLMWQTNTHLWKLTYYDGCFLTHHSKDQNAWHQIFHEKIQGHELEHLTHGIFKIITRIEWD